MILVNKIKIDNFRSIRTLDIDSLSDLTSISGLNNSGKSNVLRAVNAFFNDVTEGDESIDIPRDYYRLDKSRAKKSIKVEVQFTLPQEFKFRKSLSDVEDLFEGSRVFSIAKEWTIRESQPSYYLDGAKLDAQRQLYAEAFLRLIKFRYIPARTSPLDVIRGEESGLRDVLVRRLAKNVSEESQQAFQALATTSQSLLLSVAHRFSDFQDIGNVELQLPRSWKEIVFSFAYAVINNETSFEDFLQGSGIQSLLMLRTLYLIDSDFSQQFGWRQASIWALEEPETSMHTSLVAQIAAFLAEISVEPRLQVICTTHSHLIIGHSGKPTVLASENGTTTARKIASIADAVQQTANLGITEWQHPLLFLPTKTLILVEGKSDYYFLKEVERFYPAPRNVHISFLENLEQTMSGGTEQTITYLKNNKSAIAQRPDSAPVILLLDEDSAAKTRAINSLGMTNKLKAIAWPPQSKNPKLSSTLRGLETLLSERIIRLAAEKANIDLLEGRKKVSVDNQDLGKLKEAVLSLLQSNVIELSDLSAVATYIQELWRLASNPSDPPTLFSFHS